MKNLLRPDGHCCGARSWQVMGWCLQHDFDKEEIFCINFATFFYLVKHSEKNGSGKQKCPTGRMPIRKRALNVFFFKQPVGLFSLPEFFLKA